MADEIKTILGDIAKASTDVGKLNDSLNKLAKTTEHLKKVGNVKQFLEVDKLRFATQKLIEVKKKHAEIEEKLAKGLQDGKEATAESRREYERSAKSVKNASKVIEQANASAIESYRKVETGVKELEEKQLEYFKTQTLFGEALGVLTSSFTKFAAGATLGAMALKALGSFTDAARMRGDLMIKSFSGMDKSVSLISARDEVVKFQKSLVETEAYAKYMGARVEDVQPTMMKFARITGSTNPDALKKLTQASISVARTLDIDVSEATEYVSLRMQKFGGSAASALLSLHEMRKGVEETNQAFGRTVLRGDDVAKTLLDLARNSSVYALDQRFVSQTLRDNITRLQAMGDSYDQAQGKAKAFLEGTTAKAPEWMQINVGEKMVDQLAKSMTDVKDASGKIIGKQLSGDMAAELDKEMPGTAAKIGKILSDPKLSGYSKTRAVQEMLNTTKYGQKMMNSQLLDFVDRAGGEVAILMENGMAKNYNEAVGLVDLARAQKKEEMDVVKLKDLSSEELKKQVDSMYGIGKMSEYDAKMMAGKKDKIEEFVHAQEQSKVLTMDQKTLGDKQVVAMEKVKKYQEELNNLKKQGEEAKFAGSIAMINSIEKNIADTNKKLEEAKADVGKTPEQVGSLEGVIKDGQKGMENTAILTGDALKAAITEQSTVLNTLAAGVGIYATKSLFNFGAMEKHLAKIASANISGPGTTSNAAEGGGMMGKLIEKLGTKGGKLGGAAKMLAKFGPAMKTLGKFSKLGGPLVSMAMAAPEVMETLNAEGSIMSKAKKLLPTATGMLGGVLGGIAGSFVAPGVGTVAGGMGGQMLGESIGKSIASWLPEPSAPLQMGTTPTSPVASPAGPASGGAIGGGPSGEMGSVNPDGSVNMVIKNFLPAFGSAQTMVQRNVPRSQ